MTVVALGLTITAMIVALGRHRPFALPVVRTARGQWSGGRGLLEAPALVSVIGMGALMFIPLLPAFTPLMTAALGGALLLVVVVLIAVGRMRSVAAPDGGRLRHWQRCVSGIAVIDLGFMSICALVMPTHGTVQVAAPLAAGAVAAAGMSEPHSMTAGGVMIWAVLATWVACVVVLVVPAMRAERRTGVSHATCSGLMIAAMAALVVASE